MSKRANVGYLDISTSSNFKPFLFKNYGSFDILILEFLSLHNFSNQLSMSVTRSLRHPRDRYILYIRTYIYCI